jgi:hypothetical protein
LIQIEAKNFANVEKELANLSTIEQVKYMKDKTGFFTIKVNQAYFPGNQYLIFV